MALIVTFLLGIANFAMHKAVLSSRHPVIHELPMVRYGPRVTLSVEFAILLGAMLLTANSGPGWAIAYAIYTALNGVGAWLILTRRM